MFLYRSFKFIDHCFCFQVEIEDLQPNKMQDDFFTICTFKTICSLPIGIDWHVRQLHWRVARTARTPKLSAKSHSRKKISRTSSINWVDLHKLVVYRYCHHSITPICSTRCAYEFSIYRTFYTAPHLNDDHNLAPCMLYSVVVYGRHKSTTMTLPLFFILYFVV